jgi:hypothetical protein
MGNGIAIYVRFKLVETFFGEAKNFCPIAILGIIGGIDDQIWSLRVQVFEVKTLPLKPGRIIQGVGDDPRHDVGSVIIGKPITQDMYDPKRVPYPFGD